MFCVYVSQLLCIFLSETKVGRLANERDVQMGAVADGLATCMWTLETIMKLDTERQTYLPIKLMTRWMLQQRDLLFACSQPFGLDGCCSRWTCYMHILKPLE